MQEKNEKNAELSARLSAVIENEHIKANAFAKKLGYERTQTIYDIISTKSAPSFDFFSRFESSEYSEKYNVSWLISGRGEMLKNKKPYEHSSSDSSVVADKTVFEVDGKKVTSSGKTIPLYDIRSSIGFRTLFTGANQSITDTVTIPDMTTADGAMYVIGDSMDPLLKPADIIIFKKISTLEYFSFGEIYILTYEVDGDEHCVLKYVKKSDREGFFQLVSHNKSHQPIDIPVQSIKEIAVVKASIRYYSMG